MSTLYRPIPIETAEQAEALPIGTLATLDRTLDSPRTSWDAARKHGTDWWRYADAQGPNAAMVGWTALLPIEAGEESFEAETGMWARLTTAWENRPVVAEVADQ